MSAGLTINLSSSTCTSAISGIIDTMRARGLSESQVDDFSGKASTLNRTSDVVVLGKQYIPIQLIREK